MFVNNKFQKVQTSISVYEASSYKMQILFCASVIDEVKTFDIFFASIILVNDSIRTRHFSSLDASGLFQKIHSRWLMHDQLVGSIGEHFDSAGNRNTFLYIGRSLVEVFAKSCYVYVSLLTDRR